MRENYVFVFPEATSKVISAREADVNVHKRTVLFLWAPRFRGIYETIGK